MNRVSVVIVSAGNGTRMQSETKKQFLPLNGMPVLAWTIQVFEAMPEIHEIILIVHETDIRYCQENIVAANRFRKISKVFSGGADRQSSVIHGVMAVDETTDIVVIHDGVRPFIDDVTIRTGIQVAAVFGASCIAVPVTETIKVVKDGIVTGTVDRSTLWAAQTPQIFKKEILFSAIEAAEKDGFKGTDDASLAERIGAEVAIVPGSYDNIKITTAKDIEIAKGILQRRQTH